MEIGRDKKGRFVKGYCSSPDTEFKKEFVPWIKGRHHSEKTKSHLSDVLKGRHLSPDTEFKKGLLDELKKDKTQYDEFMKQRGKLISKGKTGKPFTDEHKAAIKRGHFSKKSNSDEVYEKINKSLKKRYASGEIQAWNKGLTKETDERLKNSIASQPHSKEWNENVGIGLKNSKRWKEYIKSEKHRKDCSKGGVAAIKALQLAPNGPESKFIELCKKYNLPYMFVGDGQFWLGHPPRNPDFLNTNGEKTVVEIHGVYWHLWKPQKKNPNLTRKMVEAEEHSHYSKYGFKSVVIWEDELNNDKIVLNKLA